MNNKNVLQNPVIVFCNNLVGLHVLNWLIEDEYNVVAVVTHNKGNGYYLPQIVAAISAAGLPHFAYDKNTKNGLSEFLDAYPAEVGLSAYFGFILEKNIIETFSLGILNLHGGYLPWCRGKNPNAWAVHDRSPAGVTLHLIDENVDCGMLLNQQEIIVAPDMSAKDVYLELEKLSVKIIRTSFPRYLSGEVVATHFLDDLGSYHAGKELAELKRIDLDSPTTAGELFNRLQAGTFPPFEGPYFYKDGIKYEIGLKIERVLE